MVRYLIPNVLPINMPYKQVVLLCFCIGFCFLHFLSVLFFIGLCFLLFLSVLFFYRFLFSAFLIKLVFITCFSYSKFYQKKAGYGLEQGYWSPSPPHPPPPLISARQNPVYIGACWEGLGHFTSMWELLVGCGVSYQDCRITVWSFPNVKK